MWQKNLIYLQGIRGGSLLGVIQSLDLRRGNKMSSSQVKSTEQIKSGGSLIE